MPPAASSTRSDDKDAKSNVANGSNGQAAGSKRKADEVASPNKAKKEEPPKKAQKSLEETMPGLKDDTSSKDEEMKDADHQNDQDEQVEDQADDQEPKEQIEEIEANDNDEDEDETNKTKKEDSTPINKTLASASAVQESTSRSKAMPSTILEKGLIYFFTRPRVGIDDPESAADLQRTFFVLRPLPHGAKLGDGALDDSQNNRLLALPKKVFPKSHTDRFMAFVQKAGTSIQELKKQFFEGETYETKSLGTRETPPVELVGEGVYALTAVERSSHLAYLLTVPEELGEVQKELGIGAQGSFVVSVKNPTRKGPANATLDEAPGFSQEIIDEFRGLAWGPVQPKHLEYANAQILLIGEGNADDLGKAVEQSAKDKKNDDKETPLEELEKLEHEDELRVEHLKGDDSVFEDLGISKKDYGLLTTW